MVAVATVGLRWRQDATARSLFLAGFREMVARLSPSLVLCYGRIPPACQEMVEVVCYPTRWQSIRQARMMGGETSGLPKEYEHNDDERLFCE